MSRVEVERWISNAYLKAMRSPLNLDNPKRFTEKLQWCKLHAMDETKSMLADKYAVRKWVAERIGEEYLIPLVGAWDNPDEIDFTQLPNSFVLKTNNASGTNIIVKDKSELDEIQVRKNLAQWLDIDFGWLTFEPQYLRIKPRVIAEEYICDAGGGEASDYKFLCFSGEPRYVRVDLDRHGNHSRATFDMEWCLQGWCEGSFPLPEVFPAKPACFNELTSLVRALAEGFGHVRVDFYIVGNRPLFGEMTFSSGSGFERIEPDEWDFHLGDMWDLALEPRCELPYGAGARLWRQG